MTSAATFRRAVLAAFAIAFIAVAWGGVVRATGSGLGCADEWPLCQGQLFPGADAGSRIEWLHRLLAAFTGVGVFVVASIALLRHERGARLWLALATVPLFLLQAILGAMAVWLQLAHEAVTVHFANAQLLLGVLAALGTLVVWPRQTRSETARGWTWLVLGALVGTYALELSGAYVRGAGATAACASWPFCSAEAPLPVAGAPLVHMLHRYIAALVGLVIAFAALAAWRRRRDLPGAGPVSLAVLALLALQVVVGGSIPLTGFAAAPLAAHPGVASALWCAVVALAVVARTPPVGARETLRDVVALTKPRVMSLLVLTAVCAAFLASHGMPPLGALVATVVGGMCASGGAASLNHYFDRDIDLLMRRTRGRPVAAHRVSHAFAIGLGIALNVVAFVVLWVFANLLAAALATLGTLVYIGVYTLWLKRRTTQNIVIGGAAGAIPPLVGYAAVTGSLDVAAWVLFAIVFFWTPAHFWALALLIRDDYERAGVPMLPVVRGDRTTTWNILAYAASLVPLSALLFVVGASGVPYLVVALVSGLLFVILAVRLVRAAAAARRAVARGVYLYSLLYLAVLFAAMAVDSALRL